MLSVATAAPLLGISARRVRVLCEQGRIPAVKMSARMWIIREPIRVLTPKEARATKGQV
jgi:excisionase family DNA binding protein